MLVVCKLDRDVDVVASLKAEVAERLGLRIVALLGRVGRPDESDLRQGTVRGDTCVYVGGCRAPPSWRSCQTCPGTRWQTTTGTAGVAPTGGRCPADRAFSYRAAYLDMFVLEHVRQLTQRTVLPGVQLKLVRRRDS